MKQLLIFGVGTCVGILSRGLLFGPLRSAFTQAVAENRIPYFSPRGKILRHAEAFRRVNGRGCVIFDAPPESAIRAVLEAARTLGATVTVPTDDISWLQELTPSSRLVITQEILRMEAAINQRCGTAGLSRYEALTALLQETECGVLAPLTSSLALDIGDAYDLCRALRERVEHITDHNIIYALEDLKRIVEDSIGQVLKVVPHPLGQGWEMYRRVMAAEELDFCFRRHSAIVRGKPNIRVFRLVSMIDELGDVDLLLDSIPGARERFDRLIAEIRLLCYDTPIESELLIDSPDGYGARYGA